MNYVALIGCGGWGRNLARALADLGVLRVIADANPAVAQKAAATHGVGAASSLEEALEHDEVRAVVIATPAATHYRLARQALVAGRDVFVEKPLALRLAEAHELKVTAEKAGRILMVGHLLQYHPGFLALKRIVDEGRCGRLQYIYSHRLNLGKIRTEENILWSFAPHDISMILALAHGTPTKVEAVGHYVLQGEIADITTTHLTFPSGLRAHIFVSWLNPTKQQRLIVVGDRGMAEFDDMRPQAEKLIFYGHTIEWLGGRPTPVKATGTPVPFGDGEPLRAEMEHFLECCRTRATPRTDAVEATRVLAVLHAAQATMEETGRKAATASTASYVGDEHEPPARDSNGGYFVHDSAVVDDGVSIAPGTRIWHFSHILKGVIIGADCTIGQNVMIGPRVKIGRGCKIQNNVSVYEGVTLEDDVFCGPSCVFTNVLTPRAHVERKDEFLPTRAGRGATIGANATVICGVTIGCYAMIGAGAVVTKDVPDHALVVGNPARVVGWVSEIGERLGPDLVCPRTHHRYERAANGSLARAPEWTTQAS